MEQTLKGKVAVVTGGNDGIGYETAKGLASRGAHTIIACRSKEKAETAVQKLKSETGSASIEYMNLDLASLNSVRSFITSFHERNLALHILINNAGVMQLPFSRTEDGFEIQLGINHIGHFLLTLGLLDIIKKNEPSRIINLTSGAHYSGHIDFDDLLEAKNYQEAKAYSQSKLANVLFTYELQRRLETAGFHKIYCHAVHPGLVKGTGITDHLDQPFPFEEFAKRIGTTVLLPEEGAKCSIHVATESYIETENVKAKYWNAASCQPAQSSAESYDVDIAKRLWEVSEKMVNAHFP